MKTMPILISIGILLAGTQATGGSWVVNTQSEWQAAKAKATGLEITDGCAEPNAPGATFQSIVRGFTEMKRPRTITFKQSPVWDNWKQIDDITPEGLANALVFIPVKPGDYYLLAAKAILS